MPKTTSNKELNKENKKTIMFYGPIIIALIMFIPVYSIIDNANKKRQAKTHPNIIKNISKEHIFIQDIHDHQERAVSIKVMGEDSVDVPVLHSGDTVYFYAKDYNERNLFEHGKLLYNKKQIQKRNDLIKMQNIKQK